MKFVISSEHRYWWPVTVRMPDQEKPGAFFEFTFKGQFRALSKTEGKALEAELLDPERQGDGFEAETIRRVLVGWDSDVVGEDGRAVAFTASALDQAMEFPWFRRAVIAAYVASLQDGGPAAGN